MLLLTRKPGDVIPIGDDIEITILDTDGNQVEFAVKAPDHLSVQAAGIAEKVPADEPSRTDGS